MLTLDQYQPTQLLSACRNTQADRSNERFCLELFRRAIAEKSQACWSAIYEQYFRLVYRWTLEFTKSSMQIGNATVDDMAQDAFAFFWRSFSSDHLAKAEGMASVLSYLKSCVWTSVQQALRKQKRVGAAEIEEELSDAVASHHPSSQSEHSVLTEMVAEKFWQVVDSCCNNERERVIARLRFVEEWKPSEIVKRRPDLATDERELFKLLRNLKDRMERNEVFRDLRKEWMI